MQNEVLYIILMDDSCHPLYDLKAAEGVPNHVSIDTRKLLRDVLRSNASTAILAHNHPTGPALPSATDQLTTLKIMQLLAPAGISILNHIIVAGGERLLDGRPRPFAGHQRPPRHFKRRQYGFLSCCVSPCRLMPRQGIFLAAECTKYLPKRLYITFQL